MCQSKPIKDFFLVKSHCFLGECLNAQRKVHFILLLKAKSQKTSVVKNLLPKKDGN